MSHFTQLAQDSGRLRQVNLRRFVLLWIFTLLPALLLIHWLLAQFSPWLMAWSRFIPENGTEYPAQLIAAKDEARNFLRWTSSTASILAATYGCWILASTALTTRQITLALIALLWLPAFILMVTTFVDPVALQSKPIIFFALVLPIALVVLPRILDRKARFRWGLMLINLTLFILWSMTFLSMLLYTIDG